jgi:hypothetical protein
MKKTFLLFALLLGIVMTGSAQNRWSLGAGYFGQQITYPGVVVQLEYESFTNETLSMPLRLEAGFYNHNNRHNVATLDLHRGFRKYVTDQLFLEQGFGAGVMLSFYQGNLWYEHEDGNLTFFTKTPVMDFMPSTTLGIGYNLSKDNTASRLLWCRSKISWQLFTRELSKPYFGLMIGYTHSFNS